MPVDSEDDNRGSGDDLMSGPRLLLEQFRLKELDLLGGQDLRGSGFEAEEPDLEYGEEG